ncbi:MAG: polyphosphate kinase 1 [Chloroflexi bacterium]|nr:MAG: polyphosphate kinase 1 [Chloroflexota bacterium]MBL1194438.1 polyphosphate kinase 1 [Chloroflexota bacterium]NOH11726.1 polyphosphate kinase 1 [Chloroflexota bacterium]
MAANSQNGKTYNLGHPTYYINRELGLLEFQQRVLEEAQDASNPLLERLKFLSIVDSNMDEFFMVRVGGLTMQKEAGVVKLSIDGKTPAEQLAAIRKVAQKLLRNTRDFWAQELKPALDEAGIHILEYQDLSSKEKENIDAYFEEGIFPVLTPLAVGPGHPFPHISNLSLNLAILIRDQDGQEHFARVKVPASLPRLLPVKRSSGSVRKDGTVPHNHYFVWIEQVIAANLKSLFPGMEIVSAHPFHVTRNADFEIQELEADDLLETMTEGVRQRRFGTVVRLAVPEEMPELMLDLLIQNLEMDANDIYLLNSPLELGDLMQLYSIDRYDLKFKPFIPSTPPALQFTGKDGTLFTAIRRGNIFLHHPYDSFDPVVNFLNLAARDPNVLAIKQTLYRVGKNSPVVRSLLNARREHGKQVAALVELKARFDEESNISWARLLEEEGVHVTYGLLGLKTHSKITLVVRKEGDNIRRYIHLGTGNYNHVTANIYEDIGMFTVDEDIGADATDLFNYLTGYSAKTDFRKLLVAPINLRDRIESMIRREIANQKKGKESRLILKMNALTDKGIIKLLYEASSAGVPVDLIVRGICCLRPGIKGISENIRVVSVVGRFLEHSRIYYFHNAGKPEIYMGSADMMPRNLDKRVEVLYPVTDPDAIADIRANVLDVYLTDGLKARWMQSDGNYERPKSNGKGDPLAVQSWLIQRHQTMGEN